MEEKEGKPDRRNRGVLLVLLLLVDGRCLHLRGGSRLPQTVVIPCGRRVCCCSHDHGAAAAAGRQRRPPRRHLVPVPQCHPHCWSAAVLCHVYIQGRTHSFVVLLRVFGGRGAAVHTRTIRTYIVRTTGTGTNHKHTVEAES